MPPIKPNEVCKDIPEVVFECFNKLINKNFVGNSASVNQFEIINLLVESGLDRAEILKKHWLDVEEHYRKAGWEVEYNKPDYNDSGDPYFVFTRKNCKQ